MKKKIIIFILMCLFLLIFAEFVIAQNNEEQTKQTKKSNSSAIKEKTNEMLDTEIIIPENLQFFAKIFFGLKEKEKIVFQEFVILVALFIFFFIFLARFMKDFTFFEGWKAWPMSFLIAALSGIGGGYTLAADYLFFILNLANFFKEWFIFKVLFALLIIVVMFFLLFKVTSFFENKIKILKMSEAGRKAKSVSETGEIIEKSFKDIDK